MSLQLLRLKLLQKIISELIEFRCFVNPVTLGSKKCQIVTIKDFS